MGNCQPRQLRYKINKNPQLRKSLGQSHSTDDTSPEDYNSIQEDQIKNFFNQEIKKIDLLYKQSQNTLNELELGVLEESNLFFIAYTSNNKIIGGFTPAKLKYYKYPLGQNKKNKYFQDPDSKSFVCSLTQNHKFPIIKDKNNAVFTYESAKEGLYEIGFCGFLYIQRQFNISKYQKKVFASVNTHFLKGKKQTYSLNKYKGNIQSFLGMDYERHPKQQCLSRIECKDLQIYKIHF